MPVLLTVHVQRTYHFVKEPNPQRKKPNTAAAARLSA